MGKKLQEESSLKNCATRGESLKGFRAPAHRSPSPLKMMTVMHTFPKAMFLPLCLVIKHCCWSIRVPCFSRLETTSLVSKWWLFFKLCYGVLTFIILPEYNWLDIWPGFVTLFAATLQIAESLFYLVQCLSNFLWRSPSFRCSEITLLFICVLALLWYFCSETAVADDLNWLKYNNQPWVTVMTKWERTAGYRTRMLYTGERTLEHFKLYGDPKADSLVLTAKTIWFIFQ